MRVRHLHQRTRPFRFGGFAALAAACVLLASPALGAGPRTLGQVAVGAGFCALWPWIVDWWRRRGPAGDALGYEMASFVTECAVVSLVLGWVSVPPLAGFAAALCLLAGAAALAGWRLLLPAAVAVVGGAAAGLQFSPALSAASTVAADGVSLLLILGFTLALGHVSFGQAQRLDRHRRALAEKSALLERVNGRLQRYLPPSLKDRVLRAPDEPYRWERRWVTLCFVDLVGFTELAERLEAELLARLLDEYLAAFVPAAEARGGEVSKLLGDGVLVVFGLRDDGGRRAFVEGGLGLCGALPGLLETLAERWRARGEPVSLEMRAGIASGFCTLGDRGGGERLDFTLIGTPVNLASRLQAQAGVNGVLLDEASAALAEPVHALGLRETLDVKGLGAVPAYRLACAEAS